MRAVISETKQILSVKSNFFQLLELGTAATRIRLSFVVDQHEAMKRGLTTVRITAYTDKAPTREITEISDRTDAAELVSNILLHHQYIRETSKKNRDKIIVQYNSDITRALNNDKLSDIRTGLTSAKLIQRKISVEPTRTAKTPITGQNGLSILATPDRTLQALALELITDESIDPADVTSVGKQQITVNDLISGTGRRPISQSQRLVEYLKSVISANAPVDARSDLTYNVGFDETNELEVFDEAIIPTKFDDFSEVFFSFELVDSRGIAVNTVIKKIRTGKELNVFNTPKVAPTAKILRTQTPGKGCIQVKQVDSIGKYVRIYRRTLNHAAPIVTEKYSLVAELPLLSSDGVRSVEVDIDSVCTTIFRVVSLGDQYVAGAGFSSVVLKPCMDVCKLMSESHTVSSRRFSHASVTARITTIGVAIDIRSLPFDVATIKLLKRDITANERLFTVIEIVSTAARRDVYTFTDADVSQDRVYEYSCGIVFVDGTEDRQGSEIVEYFPLSQNLVDTRIENVEVITDDNSYDVRFSITSNIVPTSIESVRTALQKQGLLEYFNDEILTERDKLQDLVAHSITRVNVTTGQRESFGTLGSLDFSDAESRSVNSVEPLVQGNVYRYEVLTLLRHGETLFGKLEKTSIDPSSKREYAFSPAKFRHPITLKDGNIVSESSLIANHSKEQFSFGNTGNVTTVDISLVQEPASVSELHAGQVNADIVEVSWKLNGTVTSVDHFLIAKSSLDGREIIGKSHTQRDDGEFYFLHQLHRGDMGEITYVIIPVLTDYTKGPEVVSNKIFIDSMESHFTSRTTKAPGIERVRL